MAPRPPWQWAGFGVAAGARGRVTVRLLLLIAGEPGVGLRNIGFESGGVFHLYPFQTNEKNPLIAVQMSDIVERAQLGGERRGAPCRRA